MIKRLIKIQNSMNLNQPKIDIILGTLVLINPIKPKFKRRHSSRDYYFLGKFKVDGHDRVEVASLWNPDDRPLLQARPV